MTDTTTLSTDPLARDWWAGIAQGRIGYEVCADCSTAQFYPRGHCTACGSTRVETRTAAGTGTIFSITVVHRPPSAALQPFAPYAIALVDLDEGVRLMAHADPALAIGARVRAMFVPFGDRTVPRFAAAA
ncbi:Zn-ribbon domain-containing OB-fold protein [Reyranella sp. CPCC 100927]|uniref:Zn-ribbon domain-containing OB-fold protein n=1 Tax=Reyranella sp. CPCC 100927 TaxID=2599616 RepID=UPI0011B733C0|nr:Zn-ribbon domain-containing OB-fold protein [Reyranella sp. CPCC 100927]TWT00239.1 Zn-ribbon domain-containing OB-fold protein [Reyranella sp. CPCC 100927]